MCFVVIRGGEIDSEILALIYVFDPFLVGIRRAFRTFEEICKSAIGTSRPLADWRMIMINNGW